MAKPRTPTPDSTRSWSDGYRAGLSDGIRWTLKRWCAGDSRAEVFARARQRFADACDDIARYWHGESVDYGPHDDGKHEPLAKKFEVDDG